MSEIGTIRKAGPSYELHYPEHGLIVRGQYVEWVLEAAAEIIAQTEKLRNEGDLDELKTLAEFGEGAILQGHSKRGPGIHLVSDVHHNVAVTLCDGGVGAAF